MKPARLETGQKSVAAVAVLNQVCQSKLFLFARFHARPVRLFADLGRSRSLLLLPLLALESACSAPVQARRETSNK